MNMHINNINNFSNFKSSSNTNNTKNKKLETASDILDFTGAVSFFPAVLLKNPTAQKAVATVGIASSLASGGINTKLLGTKFDAYDKTQEEKAELYKTSSKILSNFSIAGVLALISATITKNIKPESFANYTLLGISTGAFAMSKYLELKAYRINKEFTNSKE